MKEKGGLFAQTVPKLFTQTVLLFGWVFFGGGKFVAYQEYSYRKSWQKFRIVFVFLFGPGAGKREETSEQVAGGGGRFCIENRGRGVIRGGAVGVWGCLKRGFGGGGATYFFSGPKLHPRNDSPFAISAASYRGAKCPTLKTAEKVAEWVTANSRKTGGRTAETPEKWY